MQVHQLRQAGLDFLEAVERIAELGEYRLPVALLPIQNDAVCGRSTGGAGMTAVVNVAATFSVPGRRTGWR